MAVPLHKNASPRGHEIYNLLDLYLLDVLHTSFAWTMARSKKKIS